MFSSVNTMAPKLNIYENDQEVASKLCEFVIKTAKEAISKRDVFTIGLSGGSMAKFLCVGLPEHSTDWSKWRMFFCDERHVGFDDPECTYSIYKRDLMSKVPLSEDHVFGDNPDVTVDQAAKDYTKKLEGVFGSKDLPKFDLLLLGMGPDGHTCSLFPGHGLLKETTEWISPINDSPKPPPQRITMTYPIINNSRCAVFASCGAGKAQMVKEVLEGQSDEPLPAARVRPTDGDLIWFLDKPAARFLTVID